MSLCPHCGEYSMPPEWENLKSEIDDLRAALATARQENDLLNVKLIELAKINATARQEERERCAKIVEGFKTDQPGVGVSHWGEVLAAAIREGKS